MSDARKLHRFLRSVLVAGASLLIIASAAFAGNALSPASGEGAVSQLAADDDRGELEEAGNVDPRDVETPDVDDVDENEINGAGEIPTAVEVEEEVEVQAEDNQGQNEDVDKTDAADEDRDEDRDDDDEADVDDDGDDEADHDAHDSDDSGEDDD